MHADESKPITLPIDIFTHIIQALACPGTGYPDRDSLEALSLTCRDLTPLCQRQIFQAIVLNHNSYRTSVVTSLKRRFIVLTANELYGLLEIKPVIADYVKVLMYTVHTSDFGDKKILQVLRSLVSLEGVNLGFWHELPSFPPAGPQEWGMMPGDLQKALLEIIQQPSIKSLSIHEIEKTPLTTLYSLSPTVRSLRIQEVQFAPLPIPLPVTHAPTNQISLTSLDCTVSQWNVLRQLHTKEQTPLFDFAGIRALSVAINPVYDQSAGSQILRSFQNVEDLSITDIHLMSSAMTSTSLKEFMDVIDTTALQNIKSIQITSSCTNSRAKPFHPFESLQRFSTFEALQKLCLSITTLLPVFKAPSAFCEDLAKLDEHLISPGFPALRDVEIVINITALSRIRRHGRGAGGAPVLPSKEQCFPLLAKSEKIHFEFSVR